jgi:CubicO group peptidase (beta-lactamase class C family)
VREPHARGDIELSAGLSVLAEGRPKRVAVAAIDRSSSQRVTFSFIHANRSTRFEIGSITKGLTGMLLADSIGRGEMALETKVSDVLPDAAAVEAGSITGAELCTHTSGLSRSVRRPLAALRGLRYSVLGLNPYHGMTTALVLEHAAGQHLTERGLRRYSNLGAALVGQLLAVRGGADFDVLLRERILRPMGMHASDVASRRDTAPWGTSASGLPRQPWVMGGFTPAGGVYSTIEDMAALAGALLDGSAPGHRSTVPFEGIPTNSGNRRSGMFWIIDGEPALEKTMIWHNGGTGGYSSLMVVLPDRQRAIVMLQSIAGHGATLARAVAGLL